MSLVLGDHGGVVLPKSFNFLSLGNSSFVRCNKDILQVGDLDLVFSLVLESSSGIINT